CEQLGPTGRTQDGAEVATLRDPFGSVVALRTRAGTEPSVAWHQLHTHDHERAFSFYRDHFGWHDAAPLARDDERFVVFAWDAVSPPAGMIGDTARKPGVHTHWLY